MECLGKAAALTQYEAQLAKFPSAGCGNHGHMMRVANLGILAGLPDVTIEADIKARAKRKPTPGELADTIREARASAGNGGSTITDLTPEQKQRLRERRKAEREIQERVGRAAAVEAVRRLAGAPIPLDELMWMSPLIEPGADFTNEAEQRQNAALLLGTLYSPSELVYTGGEYGKTRDCFKPSSDLQAAILSGADIPPFFVINPFSGEQGLKKSGDLSYRADSCITRHAYALYECDFPEIPLDLQAAFLAGRIAAGWPIVSVTYSGGKSLHALLNVNVSTAEQWQAEIRGKLFPVLAGLGADTSCKNPSRLSRLPGHRRDNGNLQSLVYLNPRHGAPGIVKESAA